MVDSKCSTCGGLVMTPGSSKINNYICGDCIPMVKRSAKRMSNGVYEYRGFRLSNYGYYHPDRCVWWEATKDDCAWFHDHTKKGLMQMIDEYFIDL